MSFINLLFSSNPQPKNSNPVEVFASSDPYETYASNLKWISETKTKLPNGATFNITSTMRKEAFQADPLLKGTIIPFLKNTVIGTYHIETEDDKNHEALIQEIEEYLNSPTSPSHEH